MRTHSLRRLWLVLALVLAASFGTLGLLGREIHRQAPPVPAAVVSADGQMLYSKADIDTGRQVYQSMGGQQLGSIWGHGAYLAPDWSADWLHREATALLDIWAARDYGAAAFDALDAERQAPLKARLKAEMRANSYDPASGVVTVSADRARAIRAVARHYEQLFGDAAALEDLRTDYAIPDDAIPDPAHRRALAAFFQWAAWATTTERPGEDVTYTANWPHEELVGNVPSTPTVVWSVASVVLLIAGIGALAWWHSGRREEAAPTPPAADPLGGLQATPSMKATAKYFWTVIALFGAQIALGATTAHYAVEGHDFYGIPLADILPYAVTRTWHTQLAVFWIATAWLATGLYLAPVLGGREPRFQRLGVDLLYAALLLVVVGSMAGEWLGVQQVFDLDTNFWIGHQGWEYVDLGRVWQIALFAGLMLWLVLVGRGLWPALSRKGEQQPLIVMLFLSTVAIGLFYGAGLTWGQHTSLSMIEYWRWWVVHLWVEGFFEVFATAAIALLTVRLGLVRARSANHAVLFATVVFLTGGVLGTLHHLYFSGTTTAVVAVGAMFSALEVVPLALIGHEAYETYRMSKAAPWVQTYKWPILFFVGVAFWNLVGAGMFGFLINPPISLYYVQGLNLTATHGHAALFGVYGLLGIGLMLFCLRGLFAREAWSDRPLKWAFWLLNAGLAMMVTMSLFPVGALQAWASVAHGLWYARSAEFLQQPLIHTLVWLRVPGDIVFSVGALCLAGFAVRLVLAGRARRRATAPAASALPAE
ncbi:nitric oxide reductase, NorZ apoprotein [Tistlia consotensis]|uniref:Nitric oxide reductase, NorZ apoprotein n=1 Tax=Tistlia consotensis USBA 355 TaxID=560819 RepID=A0A1Y6CCH2_9PROT|nr:nitric-oxide reductase large subunit [Tistlia consotensis]SMF56561.1 nitric oxide reductase, NorZ apoprotein [Tistlia consotensis USBA 355]SNR44737.1 nitric oxide reductase, NorZ apoprotein [Tistlia consotensis]